ncbi:hypothetical protein ACXGQW_00640 [Wenyingzhuangia sp. IMCC45533]
MIKKITLLVAVSSSLSFSQDLKFSSNTDKIYWGWPNRSIQQYSSGGSNQMIRFTNSMDNSNLDGGFEFTDHTGVSVLRINQYKIGIGKSIPEEKLHVVGKSLIDTGNGYLIKFDGYQGIETSGNSHWLHLNRYKNDNVAIGFNSLANVYLANGGGKVGIGTSDPKEKLEINGNLKFSSNTNKIYWGWPNRSIQQYSSGGSNQMIRFTNSMDSSNLDGGFEFTDHTGVSVLRINQYKVGIGKSIPEEKLHVVGKSLIDTGNGYLIKFDGYQGIETSGNSHWLHLNRYKNDNVAIGFNSLANVYLANGGGKVGIGTSNTGSHKLAVEGSIGAREIKVESPNWSDFVFYENYTLPELLKVEKFIQKNGHLKDIPSTEEVIKNGINLGEMNSKLLQKIEELTLYTIAQEKRLNKIEEENINLKSLIKRINFLENKMK